MQEADEQDTCRICSAPAEPDQPLFHPCKCSGTIRYIHQDCLTTWLAHSKKKNCDVCKHPYSFTKVYAPNMPSRLPIVLLIRRLIQSAFFAILYGIRAIVVAVVWLAVLPLVTVWTWRMYFSMGDSTAWWISDRERPAHSAASPFYYAVSRPENASSGNWFNRLSSHPLWKSLSADIFSGQIIASLIVLIFVAVFLLREWITQNARPGVFDDDVDPEHEEQGHQAPNEQQREPEQGPALVVPPPYVRPRPDSGTELTFDIEERHTAASSSVTGNYHLGKGKQKALDPTGSRYDPESPLRHRPRRSSSSPHKNSDLDSDVEVEKHRARVQRQSFTRRLHTARMHAAKRREQLPNSNQSDPVGIRTSEDSSFGGRNYAFTFRADPPSRRRSTSGSGLTSSSSPAISVFPQVSLEPPKDTIPFSISPVGSPDNNIDSSSPVSPTVTESQEGSLLKPKRPPLPGATVTDFGSPGSITSSPAKTPLESPSLATYRAPEELEAGPSNLRGYFDQPDDDKVAEAQGNGLDSTPNISDEDEPAESLDRSESPDASDSLAKQTLSAEDIKPIEEAFNDLFRDIDLGPPPLLVEVASEAEEDDDDEEEEEEEEEEHDWMDDPDDEPQEIPVEQGLGQNDMAANPQPAPEGAVDAEDAAAIAEAQEDLEANAGDDDMEGALEAIGLRGPVYGVLQNATLMIFVLDTAMGLGIWIPYTIGKSTALLSLDPPRLFTILHLPIRAIRLITDPFVDLAILLISAFIIPSIVRLGVRILDGFVRIGVFLIGQILGQPTADRAAEMSEDFYLGALNWTGSSIDSFTSFSGPRNPAEPSNQSQGQLEQFLHPVVSYAEPYFASLGAEVRVGSDNARASWANMALGNGASEKAFALAIGYIVVGLMLAVYLNILTVGNMKSAGRAVRNVVNQQLLVLKVATFIFIELVTFPLGCGIVLDVSTVYFFPEASLMSRLVFFMHAPVTSMFYHWVAGTMFMYSFAVLLSGCRSIMRSGAMWFIKDPQDPNAHPIRDILDRPTLTQLRKICVSGLMYTAVVLCLVGSVAALLLLGSRSIMPFRWKTREPLSQVPIDLLFLHFVLPYTMRYFRPKRAVKRFAMVLWKYLAARLRLSSYFFGERREQEEFTPKFWRNIFNIRNDTEKDTEGRRDGTMRRVPAVDNVVLPRDMRATAQVNEEGEAFNDDAKKLMDMQDAEAEKANRQVSKDYQIVYIPPRFRERILLFILLLWSIGSLVLGIVIALPIQVGRSFFNLFVSHEVHDGYSFIVGCYLLWACYIVGKAVDRLDKRRQRRPNEGSRADLRVLVIKRGLLWVLKSSYMVFFLGFVIPTLIALVLDLYLVLPIRMALDPKMLVPRIRIVDSWALGLLYAKIALNVNRLQRRNQGPQELREQIPRGLERIFQNGWSHPEPFLATKELIAPAIGGLLGMILFPAAVFQAFTYLSPHLKVEMPISFFHIYPAIFVFAAACRAAVGSLHLLSLWSQAVRDKEFLVEMRLKNHDPSTAETIEDSDEDPADEAPAGEAPVVQ